MHKGIAWNETQGLPSLKKSDDTKPCSAFNKNIRSTLILVAKHSQQTKEKGLIPPCGVSP